MLNRFGRKVSELGYYSASQLRSGAAPVNDIHTHPAEPRTLRVGLRASPQGRSGNKSVTLSS